jgi:hypothetical protein
VRAGLVAAIVLVAVLAAGGARQLVVGARAVVDCDVAAARDDLPAAIGHARAAAEAVLPGSPYPRRGYERLDRIARESESRGDDATALAAWRAMRAAAGETSGLGVPSGEWRTRADEGLLRAASRAAPAPDPARLGELLARDPQPPTAALLLVAAALAAAAAWLTRRRAAPPA